jgi:hypothetical protein
MGSWTVSDVIVAPRTPTIGFIAQFYGKIQIRWDGSLLAHFTRHALPSFWLVAKYLSTSALRVHNEAFAEQHN